MRLAPICPNCIKVIFISNSLSHTKLIQAALNIAWKNHAHRRPTLQIYDEAQRNSYESGLT
jgi:hypothetical protein